MNLEDVERLLGERLDVLGPAPRAELLQVVTLYDHDHDHDRAGRIGEFCGNPKTRSFELLIDCEEDVYVRAVNQRYRPACSPRRETAHRPIWGSFVAGLIEQFPHRERAGGPHG